MSDDVRTFEPLAADHPLVLGDKLCPGCEQTFEEGDVTTLISVGPGDSAEARERAREGRAYTGVAVPAHYACVTGFEGDTAQLLEQAAEGEEKREQYNVPLAEAIERLDVIPDYDQGNGPEPCVHTFVQGGPALLGAHWQLDKLKELMAEEGVEEAGPEAASMGHGLVVIREQGGPLFIATKLKEADDDVRAAA